MTQTTARSIVESVVRKHPPLTVADLLQRKKRPKRGRWPSAAARHEAIYEIRTKLGYSWERIARVLNLSGKCAVRYGYQQQMARITPR